MSINKYELEYNFKTSINILYSRLSTASGLNEWFADNVNIQGDIFTFEWDGFEEQAKVIKKQSLKYIRFRWLEEENEEIYFEFKLEEHNLTKDITLTVTDFAEDDDLEDDKKLWETQIEKLIKILGLKKN